MFDRGIDGTQKSSLLSVNAIGFETMIANQRIANRSLLDTENSLSRGSEFRNPARRSARIPEDSNYCA